VLLVQPDLLVKQEFLEGKDHREIREILVKWDILALLECLVKMDHRGPQGQW